MKLFAKKTLANILAVFSIVSFTFFLMYLIPGDPVDFILKDGASLEDKNHLRQEMGLDKSFTEQYIHFIWNLAHLNLGKSVHTGEPVTESIGRQFPFTFFLSLLSLFMALLWGLPSWSFICSSFF